MARKRLDGISHEQVLEQRRETAIRERKRKGLRGITGYGCKMVRNGCYLLQKRFGRKRLGFLTLTLPTAPDYLWALILNWSEVVRKFNQEFKRMLERRGASPDFVFVTEIQEKRSRETGMLVPHLHLVYEAWDGKSYKPDRKIDWYVGWQEIQALWKRILENELGRLGVYQDDKPLDNPRVSLESVKKSAEGYLGKYMSKGKKCVDQLLKDGFSPSEIPSQWWGSTAGLRQEIHQKIISLDPGLITSVLEGIDLVKHGILKFQRAVTILLPDGEETREKIVGYALRLTESWNLAYRSDPPNSA